MHSLCGTVQEDRAHILDGATHEVGKMLDDNLYEKFRAAEQYVQIKAMLHGGSSLKLVRVK